MPVQLDPFLTWRRPLLFGHSAQLSVRMAIGFVSSGGGLEGGLGFFVAFTVCGDVVGAAVGRLDGSEALQGAVQLRSEVLQSFSRTPDERLRQILGSLTTHLHAFVQDVALPSSSGTRRSTSSPGPMPGADGCRDGILPPVELERKRERIPASRAS